MTPGERTILREVREVKRRLAATERAIERRFLRIESARELKHLQEEARQERADRTRRIARNAQDWERSQAKRRRA